jgi:hypothetical protein
VTADSLRAATQTLATALTAILPKLPANSALREIDADLNRLATLPDADLLASNAALTHFLPLQLARLRQALAAQPITKADIPADLRAQWTLPDGRARLQVLPRKLHGSADLRRFVDSVEGSLPQVTGAAVGIVDSADTVIQAFEEAALSAILAIALILAVNLRRPLDVALVMTPLTISALLTVLLLRGAGMSLNFANIIALPLLLGVGVSFNIYFVMNWRAGQTVFLASPTARAVIFSALTTGTAFGSLALSAHPGTASMGTLLLMSLGCTVLTSLIFVPAMLAAVGAPKIVSQPDD